MFNANRAVEKEILENINRVVQILIELSYSKGDKKITLYADAVKILREMVPNLLRLVDGRKELLESLTKQLISQKLPHPFIFNSFGDLQQDLNHILAISLNTAEEDDNVINYSEKPKTFQPEAKPEAKPVTGGAVTCDSLASDALAGDDKNDDAINSAAEKNAIEKNTACTHPPNAFSDQIEGMLQRAYAGKAIYKNYLFRSLLIDYFVPAEKIAIIIKTSPIRYQRFYDYFLKKEGIELLEISPAANGGVEIFTPQLPR